MACDAARYRLKNMQIEKPIFLHGNPSEASTLSGQPHSELTAPLLVSAKS